MLLHILHGESVHFQRKQLLLPILHGDCTLSEKATAIAYFFMATVYIFRRSN